jgi:hypothetical protein
VGAGTTPAATAIATGTGTGTRDRDRDDRWDRGGPGRLTWSGVVDDVVEVRIQGRRVEELTRSGVRVRSVRADIDGAGLPARDDVTVRVDQREGRGRVALVEQPSARNGYTAVLRVTDARGGPDRYAFTATW